ncbi:MAG: hypothetical protein AABY92_03765, partial [Thermodesulfobacteriota bacterium]
LDAELVSWAIITYSVGMIKQFIAFWLNTRIASGKYMFDEKDIHWRMGVPLDTEEQLPLKQLFANLLWRAVHSSTAALF